MISDLYRIELNVKIHGLNVRNPGFDFLNHYVPQKENCRYMNLEYNGQERCRARDGEF